MLICPNGHHNPGDRQLCQVCDALIVPASPDNERLNRRRWIVVGAGVAAALLVAVVGAVGFVANKDVNRDASVPPEDAGRAAIREWWSTASESFDEVEDAVATANHAVEKQLDPKMIEDTCQQLHDAAQVKLQAHLPSPDPDLTAEIAAAIQDIHNASHMCLSVIAGSMNSYGGEFSSNLQQGEKHLEAASKIINKSDL
jgi:hypothetical protein